MTSSNLDFSKAKRGAVLEAPGKTRITIMIDDDVLEAFRKRAELAGKGYQTMINESLRQAADPESAPMTIRAMRQLVEVGLITIDTSKILTSSILPGATPKKRTKQPA